MKNITLEIIFESLSEQINRRVGRDEETIGEIES